jgi:hypothetical protein
MDCPIRSLNPGFPQSFATGSMLDLLQCRCDLLASKTILTHRWISRH